MRKTSTTQDSLPRRRVANAISALRRLTCISAKLDSATSVIVLVPRRTDCTYSGMMSSTCSQYQTISRCTKVPYTHSKQVLVISIG